MLDFISYATLICVNWWLTAMRFAVKPHLTWITTFSTKSAKWKLRAQYYLHMYLHSWTEICTCTGCRKRPIPFLCRASTYYVCTYLRPSNVISPTNAPTICCCEPRTIVFAKHPQPRIPIKRHPFIIRSLYSNLNHSPRLPSPSLSLSEFLQIPDLPCYHVITSPFTISTLLNSHENSTFAVKHPNVVFYTTQEYRLKSTAEEYNWRVQPWKKV